MLFSCRVTAVDMPSEQRSLNERSSLIDDASILSDKLQTFLSECFFMGFIIIRSARKSVADTHTRFLVFFFFFFFFYRGCRGEFFFFISSFSLFLIAFCFKKTTVLFCIPATHQSTYLGTQSFEHGHSTVKVMEQRHYKLLFTFIVGRITLTDQRHIVRFFQTHTINLNY